MPSLSSSVPLQLHLKAPLEDLDPSAVIIEMIAMLFVDRVMGQRGRGSSSNPDKGAQSFPKSNYEENAKTEKVCSITIRENSLCSATVLGSAPDGAGSRPWTSIRGIMSDPINTCIILHEYNLSRREHYGVVTHSYYVETIRTNANKNREARE